MLEVDFEGQADGLTAGGQRGGQDGLVLPTMYSAAKAARDATAA